jgi:hypothetical protein
VPPQIFVDDDVEHFHAKFDRAVTRAARRAGRRCWENNPLTETRKDGRASDVYRHSVPT